MSVYDYTALFIYMILFFAYHQAYFFISHNMGKETREKIINHYRKAWYDKIVHKDEGLFAIQTIRNLIMINSFLVSLTMLIMGGLLTAMSANTNIIEAMEQVSQGSRFSLITIAEQHPVIGKISVFMFIMLISTYHLITSLRILYNMNFTISTGMQNPDHKEFQQEQLRRQGRYFTTGIRSLMYSAGPVLWILDTSLFISFAALATLAFLKFDFINPQRTQTQKRKDNQTNGPQKSAGQ